MKRRLVYFLKLLAVVSFTAYLTSSSVLNAQSNSKAIEITDKDGKPTIIYKESHALVIWAGNYKHWSRLNNVEAEAKDVVKTLEQRGFKVTTIGNPTGEELRSAIKNFIDNYGYKPDNRLVIFFTGHGYTRNRTKGYLVPVDARDPTSRRNEQDFLRVALPMQQIITWARLIEAKHVLFVFDSCFSGTVFKAKAPPKPGEAYIRDIIAKPVRQFIAAGDVDQEVPAKSIFTPLFIRGLEGEADYTRDGYVTGSELGVYLTQRLPDYTQSQSPQYGKIRDVDLDRGDIVFRSLTKPIASSSSRTSPESTPSQDAPRKSPNSSTSLPTSPSEPLLISKVTGVDYAQLRDFLVAGNWKEADRETSRAMLQAAGRAKEWSFRKEDIDNFSCEDLRLIDQLWRESSQGKFGFRVQKEIWQKNGSPTINSPIKNWRKFYIEVGWKTEESGRESGAGYVMYDDLGGFKDVNTSRRGNLPVVISPSNPRIGIRPGGRLDPVWGRGEECEGVSLVRSAVCRDLMEVFTIRWFLVLGSRAADCNL